MKNLEVELRVENLRELFKFLLFFTFSVLTAVVTLSYWILIKKVPFYFIIFDTIGLLLLIFMQKVLIHIWNLMEKEIENGLSDDNC